MCGIRPIHGVPATAYAQPQVPVLYDDPARQEYAAEGYGPRPYDAQGYAPQAQAYAALKAFRSSIPAV